MNGSRQTALFGAAAAFLALLATAIVLELLVRFFYPQYAVLSVDTEIRMIDPADTESPYRGDPELGLVLKPNVRFRNSAPEFSIDVQTNSLGFRAPEFDRLTASGKPRVVITGDSFPWGHGVEEKDRAVDMIAGKLPEATWLNLSVPGTGTDQHLLNFFKNGVGLAPSVVVEFVYPNDVIDNLRGERRFPKTRFELGPDGALKMIPPLPDAQPVSKPLLEVDRYFRNRSHLYALLKGRWMSFRMARGNAGGHSEDVLGIFRKERDPSIQRAMALLKALLSEYAREVRATGARFAVVVAPHKWELGTRGRFVKDDWGTTVKIMGLREPEFDLESFHREMMEWARAEAVPALGLLPYLKAAETGETGGTRVYYPRDGHWTPAGNRIVADLFISQLWPSLSAEQTPDQVQDTAPAGKSRKNP